jgi:Family of unknown function (DUF6188)
VANLRKANGDWALEDDTLVVMSVEDEPELRILANDAEGRRWEFALGDGVTRSSLQALIGQDVSEVVAVSTGELRLEFGDGTVLNVSPRNDVEAWEIRRDGESVLIGAPTGGGVIVF